MAAPLSPIQIEMRHIDVARSDIPTPVPIIEQVEWTIASGDFWLVGASPGSGKTDLLCTAAGLQKPIHGSHLLFGSDTGHLMEHELVEKRLRVGMVFTNGRLFPRMTVAENIALPICYHSNWHLDRAADEVKAALEITGLERLADLRPTQVTRNLHQRIGLARALALHPEVLMIDNPLAAVDPRQGRWWLQFLGRLAAGHPSLGRPTIVVAADDFRPWLDAARQFALIRDRQFHLLGDAAAVRANEEPAVRELLTPTFQD